MPGPRIGTKKRVEEHVVVAAGVEERAAHGPLEHEPALLGDPAARPVAWNDDEVDPMLLLRREQVVDDELDRLGCAAMTGMPFVVQLIRELERVPLTHRRETRYDRRSLRPAPDEKRPLLFLPEATLG
jgi:hypothetical protein